MRKKPRTISTRSKRLTATKTDDGREAYLQRKYGLGVAQYNWMLEEQMGRCFICHVEPSNRRLHVDHCHKTLRVRGLLCWRCNAGIAKFRDNADAMLRASHYLGREYDGRYVC